MLSDCLTGANLASENIPPRLSASKASGIWKSAESGAQEYFVSSDYAPEHATRIGVEEKWFKYAPFGGLLMFYKQAL
jgi:hypothetical protein